MSLTDEKIRLWRVSEATGFRVLPPEIDRDWPDEMIDDCLAYLDAREDAPHLSKGEMQSRLWRNHQMCTIAPRHVETYAVLTGATVDINDDTGEAVFTDGGLNGQLCESETDGDTLRVYGAGVNLTVPYLERESDESVERRYVGCHRAVSHFVLKDMVEPHETVHVHGLDPDRCGHFALQGCEWIGEYDEYNECTVATVVSTDWRYVEPEGGRR